MHITVSDLEHVAQTVVLDNDFSLLLPTSLETIGITCIYLSVRTGDALVLTIVCLVFLTLLKMDLFHFNALI